jgi:hypothetical protein
MGLTAQGNTNPIPIPIPAFPLKGKEQIQRRQQRHTGTSSWACSTHITFMDQRDPGSASRASTRCCIQDRTVLRIQ